MIAISENSNKDSDNHAFIIKVSTTNMQCLTHISLIVLALAVYLTLELSAKIQMKHTRCIFISEREYVLFKSQAKFNSKGWFSDAIFCEKAFVFSLNSTDLLDFHSLPSNCCKMRRHFQCNDFQTNIIFNIQRKLTYLSLEF